MPKLPWQLLRATVKPPAASLKRLLSSAAAPSTSGASEPLPLVRSFLYVPANSDKMVSGIAKRRPLPDLVVLDLEDGVAFASKSAAREGAKRAVCDSGLGARCSRPLAVRINPPGSAAELAEEDVRCVLGDAPRIPDVLVLPKVEHPDEVSWLAERVSRYKKPQAPIPLILMVESAGALLSLTELLDAVSSSASSGVVRPVGCVFGSDDYCSSVGVERTRSGEETRHARALFAMAVRSRRLLAIDMVEIDIGDREHFARQCREGRALGFTGKQIIHPSQLAPCHAEFSPSATRVAWAERMCAEFERHSAAGAGAFVFEGQMIDMPTVRQGQALISAHRTIALYEKPE